MNTIFLSGGWLSGASCLVSHHHSVPSQRIKKPDSSHAGFLPSAAASFLCWGGGGCVPVLARVCCSPYCGADAEKVWRKWCAMKREKTKVDLLSESLFLVSPLDRKSFTLKFDNYWDLSAVTAAESSQVANNDQEAVQHTCVTTSDFAACWLYFSVMSSHILKVFIAVIMIIRGLIFLNSNFSLPFLTTKWS